jgi:hypothetical protein
MAGQHIENLFRRLKGEIVNVKTVSGGIYNGRIVEVTNDYVCINEGDNAEGSQVFIFFSAIESMVSGSNS